VAEVVMRFLSLELFYHGMFVLHTCFFCIFIISSRTRIDFYYRFPHLGRAYTVGVQLM